MRLRSSRCCQLSLRTISKTLAQSYLLYAFHSFRMFFHCPASIDIFFLPSREQGSCCLLRKRTSRLTRKSEQLPDTLKSTIQAQNCARDIF